MALKVLRIVVKDICRLWDGHIDYPFFLADLPKGLDLYYNILSLTARKEIKWSKALV